MRPFWDQTDTNLIPKDFLRPFWGQTDTNLIPKDFLRPFWGQTDINLIPKDFLRPFWDQTDANLIPIFFLRPIRGQNGRKFVFGSVERFESEPRSVPTQIWFWQRWSIWVQSEVGLDSKGPQNFQWTCWFFFKSEPSTIEGDLRPNRGRFDFTFVLNINLSGILRMQIYIVFNGFEIETALRDWADLFLPNCCCQVVQFGSVFHGFDDQPALCLQVVFMWRWQNWEAPARINPFWASNGLTPDSPCRVLWSKISCDCCCEWVWDKPWFLIDPPLWALASCQHEQTWPCCYAICVEGLGPGSWRGCAGVAPTPGSNSNSRPGTRARAAGRPDFSIDGGRRPLDFTRLLDKAHVPQSSFTLQRQGGSKIVRSLERKTNELS